VTEKALEIAAAEFEVPAVRRDESLNMALPAADLAAWLEAAIGPGCDEVEWNASRLISFHARHSGEPDAIVCAKGALHAACEELKMAWTAEAS
jgi:hypothetical protein